MSTTTIEDDDDYTFCQPMTRKMASGIIQNPNSRHQHCRKESQKDDSEVRGELVTIN